MISDRALLGHVLLGPGHEHHDHGMVGSSPVDDQVYAPTQAQPNYFESPDFSDEDRYNPEASYNLAPTYSFPEGLGLPITKNFDYSSFIKTTWANNAETNATGEGLPLYFNLPNKAVDKSFQWDSFPAGEAQQFLTFSVSQDTINDKDLYNGETNGTTPVVLDALSSSSTQRPFTISLTVTPYNAGPIPHIHWAEDEWFILLQGEMDSWIGDPLDEPYELNEFPAGSEPSEEYYSGEVITSENIETFYYGHLTPGQSVYLPRGYAHAYRNASPSGDPLVFLTIWSRTPGYPEGGIEEFFTLPDPRIGYFFDTSNDAASFGNLNNKNIGSEDGIKNQERFVDYFNTFPDYHVAMSRNFGSFVAPDEDGAPRGGNWNPAIPNDTAAISTPPPAYWSKDSLEPWLTGFSDPGASPFYQPPAPNAPSEAVNFATPFDPTVVQTAKYIYNGPDTQEARDAFALTIKNLQSVIAESDGVLSSHLMQPSPADDDALLYAIQTTYDTYSQLTALQGSAEFKDLSLDALSVSDLDVSNSTVNADVLADNGQILVGVARVKPERFDDAVELASGFVAEVNAQELSVSSEFYVDSNEPNTLIFHETYSSGKQVNEYLTSNAYNSFASDFGPMLKTGQLASRDVAIYPVNSEISKFYPGQVAGMNLLDEILKSMPDLSLSLEVNETFVRPVNATNTSDVGGYLSVSSRSPVSGDRTYGYLTSAGDGPHILFEQPASLGGKKFLKAVNQRALPFVAGDEIQFFRSKQSADDIVQNGLSKKLTTFLDPSGGKLKGDAINFSGLSVSLDSPIQGISEVSSAQQMSRPGVVDLLQVPRRLLSGEFHLMDSSGAHLHDTSVDYGLYALVNKKGAVEDPITGKKISPRKTKRFDAALAALDELGELAAGNPEDHKSYSVEGGSLYSPYLKVGGEFYTPSSEGFSQLGENAFAFDTSDGLFVTTMQLLKSGNLPVLA